MNIEEILAKKPEAGDNVNQDLQPAERVGGEIAVVGEEEPESDFEEDDEPPAEVRTRSGRASNRPQRYLE